MIVPRRVRELRAAEDVAHRVHARGARRVELVGHDVAARVEAHAAGLAPERVGVRAAAERHEQVRTADRAAVVEAQGDAVAVGRDLDARRAQREVDALAREDALERARDVGVLAAEQVVARVDDGHARAEAPEHLAHLAADVPSADHDEVLGHPAELHERRIVEPRDLVEALERRGGGASAHVEDDHRRAVPLAARLDRQLADESGVLAHEPQICSPAAADPPRCSCARRGRSRPCGRRPEPGRPRPHGRARPAGRPCAPRVRRERSRSSTWWGCTRC